MYHPTPLTDEVARSGLADTMFQCRAAATRVSDPAAAWLWSGRGAPARGLSDLVHRAVALRCAYGLLHDEDFADGTKRGSSGLTDPPVLALVKTGWAAYGLASDEWVIVGVGKFCSTAPQRQRVLRFLKAGIAFSNAYHHLIIAEVARAHPEVARWPQAARVA